MYKEKNMKCSTSLCQKQIYAITNHKKRDLIGDLQDTNNKCCLCQDSTEYHEPNGVVLHIMLRLHGTILGPEGHICNVVTGQFDCQDRGIVEHIIPFLKYLYVTLLCYPLF